jgi:Zn-dependent protease
VDINFAQIFVSFLALVFSLTVHESAHAWAADRLGDPTARVLGRVSLNPLVHVDPIGTLLFPLVGLITHAPLIGWAKPVPVATWRFSRPRRDYLMVAAAGPLSNLALASGAAVALRLLPASALVPGFVSGTAAGPLDARVFVPLGQLVWALLEINLLLAIFNMLPIPPLDGGTVLAGLLPERVAASFDHIRPYGFVLLYALLLSGGFSLVVGTPYRYLMSWLL